MKIISFKICPCYQRISALLEALKIPYESEFLDLNNIPTWFTNISPEIEPTIQTETGEYISGLDRVVDYIDENYSSLDGDVDSEQEIYNREWSQLANLQYVNQCIAHRSSSIDDLKLKGAPFFEALEAIEKQLGDTKFILGENLSSVDIAWLPILHRAHIIKERTCYDFLENYPKLKDWQKNMMDTSIPRRSVPEDFEKVFDEFYLNQSTYLGTLIPSNENKPNVNVVPNCKCSFN